MNSPEENRDSRNDERVAGQIREARRFMVYGPDGSLIPEDYRTDQEQKKPQPPLAKAPMRDEAVSLPTDFEHLDLKQDFLSVINGRVSRRIYTGESMSLLQLSFLLWCTQGVKGKRGRSYATLRTVPCGGARHEFECYLTVQRVDGLADGFYHYLPLTHRLELLREGEVAGFNVSSLEGQKWAGKANVVFYYSCVFYRAEWRYGVYAHRVMLIDAGHITENLYLALEAAGLGGCAVGAVVPELADEAFGLDGEEESVFYAMPAGCVSPADGEKEDDIYAFVREENL